MEQFNRLLTQLKDLQLDLNISDRGKDILRDLDEINVEEANSTIEQFYRPLDPPLYELIIYYPISNGQFAPLKRDYHSLMAVRSGEIFDAISAFYEQKLTPDNVNAYLATGRYNFLSDPIYKSFGVKIYDLVDNKHVARLSSFNGGYLLELESP